MEADRLRYNRDVELAYFTAWCTEMFARQKTLDQWAVALKKFRDARDGTGKPVMDWQLEKEHMQAIRERHGETPMTPRKKTKGTAK